MSLLDVHKQKYFPVIIVHFFYSAALWKQNWIYRILNFQHFISMLMIFQTDTIQLTVAKRLLTQRSITDLLSSERRLLCYFRHSLHAHSRLQRLQKERVHWNTHPWCVQCSLKWQWLPLHVHWQPVETGGQYEFPDGPLWRAHIRDYCSTSAALATEKLVALQLNSCVITQAVSQRQPHLKSCPFFILYVLTQVKTETFPFVCNLC